MPRVVGGGSGSGTSDHGALDGLADDDHTQYATADGSRGDFEASGAVATHSADTTSVHGITDTSTLYRSGGTDVAVADGGTGASTAADARTNLGVGMGLVDADRKLWAANKSTASTHTSWQNVDTNLDIVLSGVQAGDWVECWVGAAWNNDATIGILDVASIVSASPVKYWGTDAAEDANSFGFVGWRGLSASSNVVGGSVGRVLEAGDISGGTVTLRLRFRSQTNVTRTLTASATAPACWGAKAFRPFS